MSVNKDVEKIGHHDDYIETIPDYLLNIPQKYNTYSYYDSSKKRKSN